MKKLIAGLLAAALSLSLAACGQSPASSSGTPPASGAASASQSGEGSDYPSKPIQMLIPTKPGGDVDTNGRLLSKNIEPYLGTTLVPVNVDGGGGGIAMQQVSEAAPDGYTFFYYNYAMFTSAVVEKLSYTYTDFKPVVMTSTADTQILVVSADSPYQTVDDLVKAITEQPGSVRFAATYGAPSQFHADAIEAATGGEFKKIDVSSGADKIVSLLSGEIDVLSTTTGLIKDYISSGKVTVLGSLCKERSALAPDIPTFTEQGVDLGEGFETGFVLYAHKDTPQYVIDKMVKAVEEMMANDECVQEFANSGFSPEVLSGEELDERLQTMNDYYFGMKELVTGDQF